MIDDHFNVPFIESVFHPSDFSEASNSAFAHGLAIALKRRASFTINHVTGSGRSVDVWTDFPRVRQTLESWGLLEKGSPQSAVLEKLGVGVRKVNLRHADVAAGIVAFLDDEPTDLIVLATEGRAGLPRWLQGSVAQEISRKSKTMTLFVQPSGGFVSPADGSITLRRILVPYDHSPNPQRSVIIAGRAAEMVGEPIEVTLLHVGAGEDVPSVATPKIPGCTWSKIRRSGRPVEQIAQAAEELRADLIVMATAGRRGVLDALRGSVTEQVLRSIDRPLLAVPVDPADETED